MLSKGTAQNRMSRCLHCAFHGRKYSQGHIFGAFARPSVTSLDTTESEGYNVSDSRSAQARDALNTETKEKLHVSLGETSKLLNSFYFKGGHSNSGSLSSKRWKTSLQAFDVRYHRGSRFFKDPIYDAAAEVEKPPVHPSPAECSSSVEPPPEGTSMGPDQCAEALRSSAAGRRLPVGNPGYATKKQASGGRTSFDIWEGNDQQLLQATEGETTPLANEEASQESVEVQRQFIEQMSTYFRLCVRQGRLDEARSRLHVFLLHNDSTSRWFRCKRISGAHLPNLLMRAYADKKRVDDAYTLHDAMVAGDIKPNVVTYVWLLLAALRSDNPKIYTDKVLDLMTIQGMQHRLRSAVNDPSLRAYPALMVELQQEMTSLYPDVQMDEYCNNALQYDNHLVSDLNAAQTVTNPHAGILDPDLSPSLLNRHMDMELKSLVEVESILQVSVTKKVETARKRYQMLKDDWRKSLTAGFEAHLAKRHAEDDVHTSSWSDEFLRCMPTQTFVSVMMMEVEKLCAMSEMYSPNLTLLAQTLGRGVQRKYITHLNTLSQLDDKLRDIHLKYMDAYNEQSYPTSLRQMYEDIDTECLLDRSMDDMWPSQTAEKVGQVLYDIIFKHTTVPRYVFRDRHRKSVPTFYTVNRPVSITSISKQVKPHPSIVKMVREAQLRYLFMEVETMPMFVPPVPWQDHHKGVFLQTASSLVRSKRSNYFGEPQKREILPVLDAVNVLSSVPWKINDSIHKSVRHVFDRGGDNSLDVPIAPEKVSLGADSVEGLSAARTKDLLDKLQAEAYSERMSFMLGLSVANHFKDDTFWLPYNLDFRGRAYPLSSHLGPTTSDPRRALLTFAQGKPLGTRGLEWLKMHLVNLTGLKKLDSLATRLAYAEEIMPAAFQSAETPFEGEQWWKIMDSPWQGLAACMELKAAYDSGDPVNYVSHLPIHQDGSCNGLQHYAAMGRDCLGAIAVNVTPADLPHDTYTDVAEAVEALRAKDAIAGDSVAQLLEGRITRKVVKQTVMTTVYGVTQYGAQLQITKHLADTCPHFDKATRKAAAVYLASKTFESMENMFKSSTDIQNWLTLCAHLISSVTGKPVTWRTPLGLMVTQHYWSLSNAKSAGSRAAEHDVRHTASQRKPNVQKQKNGFPPNFVHSLDSTHMMLTALRCHRAGVSFASVHDCFWTHASDVDAMNKICRGSFYELYRQPILDDLARYMMKTYINPSNPKHKFLETVLRSIPKQGELDLELVKQSDYFFS